MLTMKNISSYLDPNLIFFIDAATREEALASMIDHLDRAGRLKNRHTFYQAILDREQIVSTAIGMGVAIPHAKLPGYEEFFITVGVLSKGVHWQSIDGSLVRLIFLICGPDTKQTEYLQILSSLTICLKEEELRKKILTLNSSHDIIELFSTF